MDYQSPHQLQSRCKNTWVSILNSSPIIIILPPEGASRGVENSSAVHGQFMIGPPKILSVN
jgi:hypothetical protein